MKFCTNCGAELKKDLDYCSECGLKIDLSSSVEHVDNLPGTYSTWIGWVILLGVALTVFGMLNIFGIYRIIFTSQIAVYSYGIFKHIASAVVFIIIYSCIRKGLANKKHTLNNILLFIIRMKVLYALVQVIGISLIFFRCFTPKFSYTFASVVPITVGAILGIGAIIMVCKFIANFRGRLYWIGILMLVSSIVSFILSLVGFVYGYVYHNFYDQSNYIIRLIIPTLTIVLYYMYYRLLTKPKQ